MSNMLNESDFETGLRLTLHSLADAHEPSPGNAALVTECADAGGQRRTWLIAAAALLVLGGVAAVFAVANRDTSTSRVATEPVPTGQPVVDPAVQGAAPNADGDFEIDPANLRFSEPLPDGVAAFVNDTSLSAPTVAVEVGLSGPAPQSDSIRIIVMDGPRLLMSGSIGDVSADVEFDGVPGAPVDIGIEGATYNDADEGAIVIPIDGGRRIVGPDELFTEGSGGPFIDPADLIEIATAVGQLPLDQIDELPGFLVNIGWADGETIDPLGMADAVTVEHGESGTTASGTPSVTLNRLPEPPTAYELLAIGNALFRGELDDPVAGDTSLTSSGRAYIELVSPVDLVVIYTTPGEMDAVIAALDFAPLADLAEAFDGTTGAPPRPPT